MTPEQALEVASEIVENVQVEALKKYGELVKTNQLPKPTADTKFTPETKEKARGTHIAPHSGTRVSVRKYATFRDNMGGWRSPGTSSGAAWSQAISGLGRPPS